MEVISWSGPEDTSKLHEEVAQRPPFTSMHLCVCTLWGVLYDLLAEGERTRVCFIDVHLEVDSWSTTAPLLGQPLRTLVREIFTVGITSSSAHGHTFCLEEEMVRCAIIYWFMGCNQWFGWMTRELGRSMLTDLSKWAKDMRILVSHVNAHQKVMSAGWRLIHGLNNMDSHSPKLTLLQLLLNARCASSRD